MPRLYIPAALASGVEISPSSSQAHYLGSVMRLAPGDVIEVFNGIDGEWATRIADLKRDRVRLIAETQLRPQAPEPDLWLVFAPLKRDATDLVVQKATELGVSALLPVFTARTNTSRLNLERMASIAMEAAEQCERLSLPKIRPPVSLPDLLSAWPADRRLAAAMERAGPAAIPENAGALLVGPEGGFAPTELDALTAARFMSPICLGPRILRAETAAIAGLALLQGRLWSTN